MKDFHFDDEAKELYKDILGKVEVLKEMTGKDFIIEVKPSNVVEESIRNDLLHSSQSKIPRISLNIPLADTGESHATKRLREENEKIQKRIESRENCWFGLFR